MVLSPLITDLAYILVVASIVTIIFKRLRQPLVLGYIVAGFLAGPHMTYTPSVSSMEGIEEWSELGVIFLMFTLGLEFSFKKIVRMGMKPILTAVMVMFSMIGVGGMVASLFGWPSMDKIFLGGMLSMSSTTIIYKAFDDLGLRTKRFASGVLSVLILEDILGILLMVVLSALAVSRKFE
ncbi:MAG: cation:proton antiporter, partial [Bacteroidaceae bacterium]|nr:cation:proton antiporter [Bacteroidaceae bacterium]